MAARSMSASSASTRSCASTIAKDGLRARGQPIAVPPGMKTLPHNKSIECLAVAPKGSPLAGTLIAISERGLDADGNLMGFLIGGREPRRLFSLKRTDDFDVSDCAVDAGRRAAGAGAPLLMDARRGHAHPQRAACGDQARRAGRWAAS